MPTTSLIDAIKNIINNKFVDLKTIFQKIDNKSKIKSLANDLPIIPKNTIIVKNIKHNISSLLFQKFKPLFVIKTTKKDIIPSVDIVVDKSKVNSLNFTASAKVEPIAIPQNYGFLKPANKDKYKTIPINFKQFGFKEFSPTPKIGK